MAVWHPSPDTPPRGLLPDMSDKLKNPGPNGSGFSIRAAVFSQAASVVPYSRRQNAFVGEVGC